MKKIWAPWRSNYILRNEKEEGCIFCNRLGRKKDEEDYILYRGEKTFIIMNIFPYNNGHLMVVPYKHTPQIEDLDEEEGVEFFSNVKLAVKVLKKALKPDAFNIGMNIGRIAGAGIEEHIHIHVVPRWNGDTNFMPLFADTKIISVSLDESYTLLKKTLKELL